ncbi:hypothetical protein PINS_up005631 [Pythium insidiosum]|nr:hypothetical protein PINS_up005631 [Pythium insidiosum]
MVRKKRKGLVKDSHSGADAATAAVPFADIVAQAPLNAALVFAGETDLGLTSYADLNAWYTALCSAPTRFEQLKLLQLFRAGCKKLPTYSAQADAVAALTEATWRLLFRVYAAFSPALAGVQKNVSLVLQELAANGQATDRLEHIAREELRGVLDATLKAADGDVATSVQVLSQLQTMMEFPFLLRVIVRDNEVSSSLARVIAAIANHLDVLVQPIAAFQGVETTESNDDDDAADTTTTNTVLLASERCSHALKSAIVLASLKDELMAPLRAAGQETSTTVARLEATGGPLRAHPRNARRPQGSAHADGSRVLPASPPRPAAPVGGRAFDERSRQRHAPTLPRAVRCVVSSAVWSICTTRAATWLCQQPLGRPARCSGRRVASRGTERDAFAVRLCVQRRARLVPQRVAERSTVRVPSA